MSNNAASAPAPRVPFAFPFDPPAIALPVSRADFLTHHLSAQTKETVVGGTVKVLAGLFALGGLWTILSKHRERVEKSSVATIVSNSTAATTTSSTSASASSPSHGNTHELPSTFETSATASAKRRSTIQPSTHIDALRRKTRASVVGGSSAVSSSGVNSAAQMKQPTAPFTIGIVTPRSLERYGMLLQGGFLEHLQRDNSILKKCDLLIPGAEESHSTFASRVRAQNFDVLLLQYHGASAEDVIAFLDYGVQPQKILLLHRPEEILERHAQHVFKQDQFNVHNLLKEVDVSVVLGESARGMVQKVLPAEQKENVCVVPHGFSALDESLLKPRKLAPVVIGALTNWNEMRWLSDVLQMHSAFLHAKKKKGASAQTKNAQVVLYACGRFQSYFDLVTKTQVDQLAELSAKFPDRINVVQKSVFDAAEASGEVTDVQSLKSFLWTLSSHGQKVVVCNSGALFDSPVHNQVFDFSLQLYREHLKNYEPKIEFSGALHANPGASLPIVFESVAMGDVEIEGMNLIPVPYTQGACCNPAAAASSPECCPWYSEKKHCPDFTSAVDAVLKYVAQPSHYQAHRQATFGAAKELTMRHVGSNYAAIVKSLNGL